MTEDITRTVEIFKQHLGPRAPKVAVLLGTGWGPFAQAIEDAVELPYADLPAFPKLAVGGHAGSVRAGRLAGQARAAALAWK
jgi:purine-nucleoside phosphorylase